MVPVVFYQGQRRWRHATEFSELFSESVRRWPWTPRFEHLLVDQSQIAVEAVRGERLGRMAQLALMAAARHDVRAALEVAAQLMGELDRAGQSDLFVPVVRYVIETQEEETVKGFGEALRRQIPGPGGDMKTYAEVLIQEGHREGRQEGHREGRQEGHREGRQEGHREGRQEGQVATIESLLRAGIEWSVIEHATGIDQEAFDELRRQTKGPGPANV